MKTFSKIFAIAAIAAASLLSAQNANAAVLTYDDDISLATETDMPPICYSTFAEMWGSQWAQYDAMIADNPNQPQIFMQGIEFRYGMKANSFTQAESVSRMQSLQALNCPTEVIMALLFL